jgi:hypothetical protein
MTNYRNKKLKYFEQNLYIIDFNNLNNFINNYIKLFIFNQIISWFFFRNLLFSFDLILFLIIAPT